MSAQMSCGHRLTCARICAHAMLAQSFLGKTGLYPNAGSNDDEGAFCMCIDHCGSKKCGCAHGKGRSMLNTLSVLVISGTQSAD